MTTAIANDEVVRFMIPSATKELFQEKCARSGQKMSERMRYLVARDIADEPTPADRLSGILASARAKNEASGLAAPTIDDIDAFIDAVRAERIESGLVS